MQILEFVCILVAIMLTRTKMDVKAHHTAPYGLITTKTRQNVVPREADDVVRVDVEFKTSYSRFIDAAVRGGNRNGVGRGKKFWTAQNFSPRTTMGGTPGIDVQHTWNTRDNPCSVSD